MFECGPQRVVGDGVEVDALAPRSDRRQQVVGSGRDQQHDRARRRLFDHFQHRVGRLVLIAAQALGFEQDQHPVFSFDRRARRLGKDPLPDVVPHAVLRAGRRELDHVGVHTASHESESALVVADADEQRRELARRILHS